MKVNKRWGQTLLEAYKGIKHEIKVRPEMTLPFTPDEFYKENENNFFYEDNQFAYISLMLYKRGPLTHKEIFSLYKRDKDASKNNLFNSKHCSPNF